MCHPLLTAQLLKGESTRWLLNTQTVAAAAPLHKPTGLIYLKHLLVKELLHLSLLLAFLMASACLNNIMNHVLFVGKCYLTELSSFAFALTELPIDLILP